MIEIKQKTMDNEGKMKKESIISDGPYGSVSPCDSARDYLIYTIPNQSHLTTCPSSLIFGSTSD